MSSMLNFLRDFISEILHNFRRRGFVRIMFFDGGAVSVGVTIFALANMGGSSSAFVSGFGMGITSIGTLGLMSSLYENNMSFSRVVGYFFYEGGALQAGALIYSLSNYGPPDCRIPALAYIGIGVGCIGVFFALVTLRQMAVLYNDESIQILRDLRRFYTSQNSIRYRKTRRRRSIVRSIGLQLRVLAWNLRRRQLKESPTTAEGESTEMPPESDSTSSEQKDGVDETSTEAGGRKESLFSWEEPHARSDVNPEGRTCYPLDKESQIRGRREDIASSTKHQKVQSSSGKDKYETYSKDEGSQIVHGARKKVYPSRKSLEGESVETHGARKQVSPSKESTTKKRAERQPIAELRATRDRSPCNATLEADDLKSLEQVFGVSPPRKVSPEPIKQRKVDSGGISPQKTKIQTSLKKKVSGGSPESRKKVEQTMESKSDKRVEQELARQKEPKMDAERAPDERGRSCFDHHFDMKQEINSAVEELVAILKTFIKPTHESNLDVTQAEREMGGNAEATEMNLANNSNTSLTPEPTENPQNSSTGENRQVFPTECPRESRRLYPISVEEYRLKGPTVEVIKVILGGCTEESQSASEDSAPEGGHTTETLATISGKISDSHSMMHLESVDMHQQKSSVEIGVGVLDVSSKTLVSGLDANELKQEQCENAMEEIPEKCSTSDENPELTVDIEEQPFCVTEISISEAPGRYEELLRNKDDSLLKEYAENDGECQSLEVCVEDHGRREPLDENVKLRERHPVEDSVLPVGEPESEEKSVLYHGEVQHMKESVESSSKSELLEERVECRSETRQRMEDDALHLGEIQPAKDIVLLDESRAVEGNILHRDDSQPVKERVESPGKPQGLEERIESPSKPQCSKNRVEYRSESRQPMKENVLLGETQPMEQNVVLLVESQSKEKSVVHRDESQPLEERVESPSKPQPLEEHVGSSREPQILSERVECSCEASQPKTENLLYLGELQRAEDSVVHSDESQPVRECVESPGKPQSLAERVEYHNKAPQPIGENVPYLGDHQRAEDSAILLSEHPPAEDSVILLSEHQSAEDSVILLSESPPAEDSAILLSESQPAEYSMILLSEPELAEDSVNLLSAPQPAEFSMILLSEPQPVEESSLHRGEPQRLEERVQSSDESVEENVFHVGEAQTAERQVFHQEEPESENNSMRIEIQEDEITKNN